MSRKNAQGSRVPTLLPAALSADNRDDDIASAAFQIKMRFQPPQKIFDFCAEEVGKNYKLVPDGITFHCLARLVHNGGQRASKWLQRNDKLILTAPLMQRVQWPRPEDTLLTEGEPSSDQGWSARCGGGSHKQSGSKSLLSVGRCKA